VFEEEARLGGCGAGAGPGRSRRAPPELPTTVVARQHRELLQRRHVEVRMQGKFDSCGGSAAICALFFLLLHFSHPPL